MFGVFHDFLFFFKVNFQVFLYNRVATLSRTLQKFSVVEVIPVLLACCGYFVLDI